MAGLTVGDVACGRAGDKGATLDLTVVARDDASFQILGSFLTAALVSSRLGFPEVIRYDVPALRALKYVLPGALGAGPWASSRAGVHWQKTAISAVLAIEIPQHD